MRRVYTLSDWNQKTDYVRSLIDHIKSGRNLDIVNAHNEQLPITKLEYFRGDIYFSYNGRETNINAEAFFTTLILCDCIITVM